MPRPTKAAPFTIIATVDLSSISGGLTVKDRQLLANNPDTKEWFGKGARLSEEQKKHKSQIEYKLESDAGFRQKYLKAKF